MPKPPDWTLAIAAKVRRHQLRHHRKAGEALRELLLDGLRHAVLLTTELLELILVHLPIADIGRLREVCRRWNAAILSSPAIQSKLFLKLREPLDRFWSITSVFPWLPERPVEGFKRVPTSASVKTYQAKLLTSRETTNRANEAGLMVLRLVRLNPLFRPIVVSDWAFATGCGQPVSLVLDSVARLLSGQWSTPMMLESFITDPPCHHAVISCHWRGERTLPENEERKTVWCILRNTVHSTTGLTIRDVVRAFFKDHCAKTLVRRHLVSVSGLWSFPNLVGHFKRQGYKDDEKFCLKFFRLTLMGVVVPTEEQWRTVV